VRVLNSKLRRQLTSKVSNEMAVRNSPANQTEKENKIVG